MDVQQAFNKFDAERKGYLTAFQTKCAVLACTGVKPSKKIILQESPSGEVTLEQLADIVRDFKRSSKEELQHVFKEVFADQGEKCSLSRFRQVGEHYGISNDAEIFVNIDSDKKGYITSDDLVAYLRE